MQQLLFMYTHHFLINRANVHMNVYGFSYSRIRVPLRFYLISPSLFFYVSDFIL